MGDQVLQYLRTVPWLSTIEAASAAAVGIAAILALKTWRKQARASVLARFLESLTEATFAYTYALGPALEQFRIIRLSISAFSETQGSETSISGIQRFVEDWGDKSGQRLRDYLNETKAPAEQLGMLLTKSVVLDLVDRSECESSIGDLLRIYESLSGVSALISSSGYNWENPEVVQRFSAVLTQDVNQMSELTTGSHKRLLDFVKKNIRRMYGAT